MQIARPLIGPKNRRLGAAFASWGQAQAACGAEVGFEGKSRAGSLNSCIPCVLLLQLGKVGRAPLNMGLRSTPPQGIGILRLQGRHLR